MAKLTALFAIVFVGAVAGLVAHGSHHEKNGIPPQALAVIAKESVKAADCKETKFPVAGATFQWPTCNLKQGA